MPCSIRGALKYSQYRVIRQNQNFLRNLQVFIEPLCEIQDYRVEDRMKIKEKPKLNHLQLGRVLVNSFLQAAHKAYGSVVQRRCCAMSKRWKVMAVVRDKSLSSRI